MGRKKYVATASAPTAIGFSEHDEPMTRKDTLLDGDPDSPGGTRTAPAVALSLGILTGTGRTRVLAALRLRFDTDDLAVMETPSCIPDSPCISWGYGPGGSTLQVLLGAAFR